MFVVKDEHENYLYLTETQPEDDPTNQVIYPSEKKIFNFSVL